MKHQKTFAFLLFLSICLQGIGCSRIGGISTPIPSAATAPVSTQQAAATNTPPPTAAPTNTPTVAPTDTPTPVPSPTIDQTATLAAEDTATAEAVSAIVNPDLEKYGVNPADGHLAWHHPETVQLELTSYMENKDYPVNELGKLTDFVVQSKITWDTSGALSLCGITFHAGDDLASSAQNRFFMMRLQFAPAWTIWRWEQGEFSNYVTNRWRSSGNIHDENNSSNLVALIVRGKDIDVFINHDKQNRAEDTKQKEGLLALSANQQSGKTTCKFANSWVWVFDK